MEDEEFSSIDTPRDREWPESPRDREWRASRPRLDAALSAAIRAPTVDGRFDARVWALVHADEVHAGEAATSVRRNNSGTRLGTPWWLGALNVVALAVAAVAVVLALNSVAGKPLAATVAAASTFGGHSMGRVLFAVLAGAAGFWFASRQNRSLM